MSAKILDDDEYRKSVERYFSNSVSFEVLADTKRNRVAIVIDDNHFPNVAGSAIYYHTQDLALNNHPGVYVELRGEEKGPPERIFTIPLCPIYARRDEEYSKAVETIMAQTIDPDVGKPLSKKATLTLMPKSIATLLTDYSLRTEDVAHRISDMRLNIVDIQLTLQSATLGWEASKIIPSDLLESKKIKYCPYCEKK